MLRQKCGLHVQTPEFTRILNVTADSYVNTVLESPPIVTDAARGDPLHLANGSRDWAENRTPGSLVQ